MPERSNHELNTVIEQFINAYDGTMIGWEVKNMYENGSSYETICDHMGICFEDYLD